MNKLEFFAMIFLACILLSACGADNAPEETWQGIAPGMEDLSAITDRTEYYDLTVKSEPLFEQALQEPHLREENESSTAAVNDTGYRLIGTQFLMGEPVQLRADISQEVSHIYLYQKDGSSELVLQDIPSRLVRSIPAYRWYLDREGNFYCIRKSVYIFSGENINTGSRQDASIVKLLPSGEILYETPLPPDLNIYDICQPENGRIYVHLRSETDDSELLAEVDPATGKLLPDSQLEIPYTSEVYLGSADPYPAVTGYGQDFSREIVKADLSAGKLEPLLYFTGTSYGWRRGSELCDFQVLEDGSIELLWTDSDGSNCILEQLRMEKVEKTPIICRGIFYSDIWLGERVSRFNQENTDYQVILEDCGPGNDISDFARLTSVQVGAGKGPDIFYGDFLQDYIDGMLEKGALEKLNPYLEASDIREEDYFSPTFATWRQGEQIYSVNCKVSIESSVMDGEILGKQEISDIEQLADALLSWKGEGVWQKGLGPEQVLSSFLEGSDSLWGMVNWENEDIFSSGSCNFDTPLFGKLLEVARRYGDDSRKNPESSICENMPFLSIIHFKGQAEREAAGQVLCGTLFDDGCHGASFSCYTMAINANSVHKEGAWEFISFLLGEASQSTDLNWYVQPVHKKAFEEWLQKDIYELTTKHIKDGAPYTPPYYGTDTSEEKQSEYRQAIEDARPLPTRTRPILAIILEEAADYFSGSKSAEEVSKVVNNRVQLYLDEKN